METELHEGEEILEEFSPARTSVLVLDYLTSFAIIVISIVLSAGLVTFLNDIPLIGGWIGSSAIILVGLILALPSIIRAEITVRGNTYYITNLRLVKEFKFIKYNSKIINFDRITHIKTDRTLIDRLFRTGQLQIKTAGTHEAEMTIKKIKNSMEIERIISKSLQERPENTGTGHRQSDSLQEVDEEESRPEDSSKDRRQ